MRIIKVNDHEEKPIFNLGFYSKELIESKRDLQKHPEKVLEWRKEKQRNYLREIIEDNGMVFTQDSENIILSFKDINFNRIEIYQKLLELNDIQSFIYYPDNSDEPTQLFIVGESNIQQFKEKIGFHYPEANKFYSYWNSLDWED